MRIIDSQVNFGKNIFGPYCNLERYIKSASEIGIEEALLISTGSHIFEREDGVIEKSCIWTVEDENVIYESIFVRDGLEQKIINPLNPYKNFNNYTLSLVKSKNKEGRIRFHFVPKVHPKLDEKEEVERLLQIEETVALKIHGIATYCTPKDIPLWIPDLLRIYDKPLLIHTDYVGKTTSVPIKTELQNIMVSNNPLIWAQWVIDNGIRAYLAHGVRLDKECVKLVNSLESLVVGIGPDLMIQFEFWRLRSKTQNYIDSLFNMLDESKVLFSTDFAWNFKDKDNKENLDWGTVNRICNYAQSKNKDDTFLRRVFYENAEKFFKLK